MAAEGLYYPELTLPYPDVHQEVDKADSQECSVRGCHRSIESNGQNKMCDECRGRHRGYATTKRLRRKLEKAALQAMGVSGEAPIVPMDIQTWDPTIDPMLYDVSRQASTSTPGPSISLSSSTSELANALTLPTHYYQQEQLPEHVPQFQENVPSQEEHGAATCISPAMLQGGSVESTPVPPPAPAAPEAIPDASTSSEAARFCSVKGCKAVIPGSYEYKMCPSCRTRYRGYGITKRTKWKNEREAFEREMTQLRAAEDERRKANGEPPLADDPVAQKEWEITILDEEIALPPPILAALKAAGVNADGTLEAGSSALRLYQNEPGQPSAIDTPHAIAPYPSVLGSIPQLPARMCTVSHCHQILPGYYRYKRCEQHRLQNRHHSKLKRVREKEEKAMGPKEGAAVVNIPQEAAESKMKGKAAEKVSEEALASDSGNEDSAEKTAEEPPKKKKSKKAKKVTHCVTEGCGKALPEDKRWKTCDDCRAEERRKKSRAKTNARLNKNSPPTEQTSSADPSSSIVTDDPAAEASSQSAATQPLKLVNLTADTFQTPEPAFSWSNETAAILVDSSAPVDLSRPSTGSQQPLTIKHYRPPKNTDKPVTRTSASQPYVIVEQFPFTGVRPRRPYERAIVNQIHVAPVVENAMPATAHKPYPNSGVFRHYVPVEEKEPEPPILPPVVAVATPPAPVSPPAPASIAPSEVVPEQDANPISPSASAVQTTAPTATGTTASKSKSNGKERAIEIPPTAPPPVANPVPQLFPYPPFPVHPYFYLPPQYNPNAPPAGYAYPGYPPMAVPTASGEAAGASGEAGIGAASTSASAPPQGLLPVPYPYPVIHPQGAGTPYAYPASVSAPVPPGAPAPAGPVPYPLFYPPYPYSASAPPMPGFAPAPLSAPGPPVPAVTGTAAAPGTSVSAPPASAPASNDAPSESVSSAPGPAPGLSVPVTPPRATRLPKEPKDPKETRFSYYHHGFGSTDSPEAPTSSPDSAKKRRKIDPAWLEKMRVRAEQEKQQQQQNGAAAGSSGGNTMGDWMGTTGALEAQAAEASGSNQVPGQDLLPATRVGDDPPVEQGASTSSPKPTTPLVQHNCSNKTCKRRVSSTSGTALCDKCKAKFKKHAEKNKRKHKLVPVKPVSAVSVGVSLDHLGRT